MCTCICVYMCTCMCTCMCVCACICVYVCVHVCMCTCMCACVCTCMCVCACICVYVCVHVCMCVHVYMCVCMCVYALFTLCNCRDRYRNLYFKFLLGSFALFLAFYIWKSSFIKHSIQLGNMVMENNLNCFYIFRFITSSIICLFYWNTEDNEVVTCESEDR